jgi:hypothetical protein
VTPGEAYIVATEPRIRQRGHLPKVLLTTASTCSGVAVPSLDDRQCLLVERELQTVGDEAGGIGDPSCPLGQVHPNM